MKSTTHEQRTATVDPPWNVQETNYEGMGLNLLYRPHLTFKSDAAPNYKHMYSAHKSLLPQQSNRTVQHKQEGQDGPVSLT